MDQRQVLARGDASFRVLALLSSYNEGDVISPVIGHLVANGVDVYLLDNRSTDDTVAQASEWLGRGLIEIERFPGDDDRYGSAAERYDWTAILRRKEELARTLDADWFLHYDADEIRESPWPGMTLREAIRVVDGLGYNCIDFRVFEFPPIDNGFRQGLNPAEYFTHYREAKEFDQLQLKGWKGRRGAVSLTHFGGHDVDFEGRRICPIPFLLRHYPIRSQAHGLRKVFEERKKRFADEERAKTWHRQYDHIQDEAHSFVADPEFLRPFDLDEARLEVMVRNRDASERAKASTAAVTELEAKVEALARSDHEREALVRDLEARAGVLEYQLGLATASFARREAEYQAAAMLREAALAESPRARTDERGAAVRVTESETRLAAKVAAVTAERDAAQSAAVSLRQRVEELGERTAALDAELSRVRVELNTIYTSKTWRWGEPIGRFILTLGFLRKKP